MKSHRLHYAWVVLGVTFITLLLSAGVRATPAVLIVPLEREFGWTRATISFAISVGILLYGLTGPFAAGLMQRLGLRRTMLLALGILVVGVGLSSRIAAPWQLVLVWGCLVGVGTGMAALVLGAAVANRWFVMRRGLAMGLLTASTASGQLVFLPLLASISVNFGWRMAVLFVAGCAALLIPLVALFMSDDPASRGLLPYGGTALDVRPMAGGRNPAAIAIDALRTGMRSRDFWLLSATFFICGASTNGLIGTHLVSAAHDHGITEVKAAGLLAAMGVFDFIGTTLSGWLSDRYDNRWLLAGYYSLRGLSLMFLPPALVSASAGSLGFFALIYGLDWVATVPPTVRLAGDAFGREIGTVMFGWISAGHQVGAATAALLAGAVRTSLGDYRYAFLSSGALCLVAAMLALRVGGARHTTASGVRLQTVEPSPSET